MKIMNFTKKIINFDVEKKNSPAAGTLIGNLLKRRAGLRRPTASGLNCGRRTPQPPKFGVVNQISIGFRV